MSKTKDENQQITASWTFFTNHTHVLIVLSQHPEMVLREVALKVGITERSVQNIVADLEEAGFIIKEKVGRSNKYRIDTSLNLRHPIEAHQTVGEVISLILGGETKLKKTTTHKLSSK